MISQADSQGSHWASSPLVQKAPQVGLTGIWLTFPQLKFLYLSLLFVNHQQLDQVTRQRSLSSLELFLSCAQKQLNALIATEPVDVE